MPESAGERLGGILVSGKEEPVSKSALIGKTGLFCKQCQAGVKDMLLMCNMFRFDLPKFLLPHASVAAHRHPQDLVQLVDLY